MSEREVYWRGVIERHAASGLPIRKFCDQEGVSSASFFAWRKRMAGQTPPAFLPVTVVAAIPHGAAIELQTPTGVVVRIFDGAQRQTLIDVLAALAGDPA